MHDKSVSAHTQKKEGAKPTSCYGFHPGIDSKHS